MSDKRAGTCVCVCGGGGLSYATSEALHLTYALSLLYDAAEALSQSLILLGQRRSRRLPLSRGRAFRSGAVGAELPLTLSFAQGGAA
mmetsp:Transcript_28218/g.84223  ORF Transcript_28218/g.84223 Transcript_28218/m.84223 type:complete len:87 (-) Transcript_28218:333-593(-)